MSSIATVRTLDGVQVDPDSAPDGTTTQVQSAVVHFDFMGIEYDQQIVPAVYVDETGLVSERSVLAAAGPVEVADRVISGPIVRSRGDDFNGVFVAGGEHTLRGGEFDFEGDGHDDFTGVGAAISSAGSGTRLTIDGVKVRTKGCVRTPLVVQQGSHALVKNSVLEANEGVLPADYVPSPEFGRMWTVPWMLGLTGNCRAVQFVGDHGSAVFYKSAVSAEQWGVLSNDISNGARLVTIESDLTIRGASGYGVYNLGGAHHHHLGTHIDVADIGGIFDEGSDSDGLPNTLFVYDSSPERLAAVNESLPIPLSAQELDAVVTRPTVIRSRRFGFMLHVSIAAEQNPTQITLADNTRVETGKATFLVKGVGAQLDVGPHVVLRPADGVVLQLIDSDDPGPRFDADGHMVSTGVYREKAGRAEPVAGFDLTVAHPEDVRITFRGTEVVGDLINGWRNGTGPNRMGGDTGIADEPDPSGKNVVVRLLDGASLTGAVSSAFGRHHKDEIGADDWRLIGEVANTREPGINNGTIVTVGAGSTWTAKGKSFLNRLTIESGGIVDGVLLVDGTPIVAEPGDYVGEIVLSD